MIAFITRHATKIAGVLIGGFFFVSLILAWDDALTFDEVAHIPAGYSYVTQGDMRLNPEHPPLVKALSGIFLLPLRPTFDTTQKWWTTATPDGEYGQWDAGRHVIFDSPINPDIVIFFARIPIVLLAVFCAALLFGIGRSLAGPIAGLLALSLFVFSPSVLGHAHLVTTDIAIAGAITLSIFTLVQYVRYPSVRSALIAGIAFGIALVTKFSAILIAPFAIALIIGFPLIRVTSHQTRRTLLWLHTVGYGVVIALVTLATVWVIYAPFSIGMPQTVLATIAPPKFSDATSTRNQFFLSTITHTNKNALTRPFAAYLQGLGQVFNRVDGGNTAYFMGTVSNKANPWYFPIVFLAKETLPHLTLIVLACIVPLVAWIRKRTPRLSPQQWITAHPLELTLAAFVLFYAYISITGNLTIGYRHLFPLIPPLYLIVALSLARGVQRAQKELCVCRHIPLIVGILIASALLTTIHAFPFYISYFNPTVGGSLRGYSIVTDSNADWGQDAKRLAQWLDAHPEIGKIRVDYFGGDRIAQRLGDRMIPWSDDKRPIETGWYALSANYMQNSIFSQEKNDENSYRWLRTHTPVARVGTSIFIYFIDTEKQMLQPAIGDSAQ